MLSRLHRLADGVARSHSKQLWPGDRWLLGLRLVASGYEFHLIYFWLSSPDLAVARVADRVRKGGHDVPEETIRQRYHAG